LVLAPRERIPVRVSHTKDIVGIFFAQLPRYSERVDVRGTSRTIVSFISGEFHVSTRLR
jgi:hypothetical protein